MRFGLIKTTSILALFCLSLAPLAPLAQARSVSAIKGKDETNFADPETRCNTAEMRTLNKQAINQMLTDIKQRKADGSQAAKLYQYKLDLIWDAMLQPYCGYGSRGITAVRKSFQKSVNRARTAFLGEKIVLVAEEAGSDGGND